MPEVLTNPGEVETVTTPPAQAPRPTVEVLKEVIARHCRNQGVTSVENLCHQQTEGLIDELAPLFR